MNISGQAEKSFIALEFVPKRIDKTWVFCLPEEMPGSSRVATPLYVPASGQQRLWHLHTHTHT